MRQKATFKKVGFPHFSLKCRLAILLQFILAETQATKISGCFYYLYEALKLHHVRYIANGL